MITRAQPSVASRTAIVAAAFSLIVCGMLVWNYAGSRTTAPLNSPRLSAMKRALGDDPHNQGIRDQIRALDFRLRAGFFRWQRVSRSGAWLLAGGLAVLVLALNAALVQRPQLPRPGPEPDERAEWRRRTHAAHFAMAMLGIVLGGAAVTAIIWSNRGPEQAFAVALNSASSPHPAMPEATYPAWDVVQQNWPCFRGPQGAGIAAITNLSLSWDGATGIGILWKTPGGLFGKSSPVVWGNRLFVTGADKQNRRVACYDADTGQRFWESPVSVSPGKDAGVPTVTEDSGYAAPTPATDGTRVYAIFANGDIAAFDFAGKQVWSRNLGLPDSLYGYAASLTMWRNLVIVQYDQASPGDGKSALIALNGATGATAWRTARPVGSSWASPVTASLGDREQIITCADPWVISNDPATGNEIWRASCLGHDVAPSPILVNGIVYAALKYACLAAVRADGHGDVTGTNVLWQAQDGLPDICSPLSNGKLVFLLTTEGTLTCYAAADGRKLWEHDFGMSFNASPSLVGNRLLLFGENGTAIVLAAADGYREISRSELGEKVYASPAFVGNHVYIRGVKNLFCMGTRDD